MSDNLSRRDLLETAGIWAAAGAALGLGSSPARAEGPPQVEGAASRRPASERIRVGFIGVGGRAQGYLRDFLACPEVDVVAMADVYDKHAAQAAAIAAEKGHKPETYRDFRRVLDHKDIDAVAIGTPDHWHALTTIYACHAGKDIYVEKPLSHTIAEGRAMVNAAKRFNRITQMGTQIHAGENYRRVVEIVQSGMLGEITKTRVWIARNEAPGGMGSPPDGAPPGDVDYDMWLGPAPKRAFNPLRFIFNWRYFWDYAGGTMADMSCHTLDLIYWAMKLGAPKTVLSTGGRYALHDIGETPDTMETVWDYEPDGERKNKMQLVWSLTEGNQDGLRGKSMGIGFYGSEATVIADYDSHEVLNRKGEPVGDRPPKSIPPSPGHVREFVDSVKSRSRCSCDIENGFRLTKVPLMANIAYKTGLKLTWDDEKEQFINAPTANRLLTKEYRAPWSLT